VSEPLSPESGPGKELSLFQLLRKHGIYPTKSLGQVFLAEEKVIDWIVDTLSPQETDVVVEIGAGPGLITKALAERAGQVIALEIDHKFLPLHQDLFAPLAKPPLVLYEDAKKADWQTQLEETSGRRLVFGNLPYYLTTELILDAISKLPDMSLALFMVEQEVGERLFAKPGDKKYGTLSIVSQLFGQWKQLRTVSRGSFFPKPNATSSLLTLTPQGDKRELAADLAFQRFIIGLMQYRRKTMANALKMSGAMSSDNSQALIDFLDGEGLQLEVRAEQLTPDQLARLFCQLGVCQPHGNPVE